MMCMVPINNIALGTLTPQQMKNASGLFNLTRNLGGAVGLALINTVLIRRGDFHYERLAEAFSWGNIATTDFLTGLSRQLSAQGLDGSKGALAQAYNLVQREASVMSFADTFYLLTVLFVILFFLLILVKKV